MNKCKLSFYKLDYLDESKNWIIESFENYLSSQSNVANINNFQWIKDDDLDTTIKVIFDEEKKFINTNDISSANFLKVTYQTVSNETTTDLAHPRYYFIVGVEWTSPNCASIRLHLDTLNTIGLPNTNFTYSIDARTKIERQHKNRYESIGTGENARKSWKVDLYSEGLAPLLYKTNESKMLENGHTGYTGSWYLIYRNSQDDSSATNNVVNCYICADDEFNVKHDLQTNVFTPSLSNYKYIKGGALKFNNTTLLPTGRSYKAYKLASDGTTITITEYEYHMTQSTHPIIATRTYTTTGNVTVLLNGFYSTSINNLSRYNDIYGLADVAFVSETGTLKPIGEWNRTDSKLIKIIECPYNPDLYISKVGNDIYYDGNIWLYDDVEHTLRLTSLNHKFENFIKFDSSDLPNAAVSGNIDLISPKTPYDAKNILYEPKLYHSDFYFKKYVYDSFSRTIPCELMNPFQIDTNTITCYTTSTINSRFLFKFELPLWTKHLEDYENYLQVTRNNEKTLYNSSYINYLRAGYNYDVKNKARTEAVSWTLTAAQIAGSAALIAVGGVTSKVAGVGMAVSAVSSLVNSINTTIQSEQSMQAKIAQLKAQSNSVEGADDIDLLEVYQENKLKCMTYQCSDKVRQQLFDLFYYTGYVSGIYGVPDTSSRYWFNFVQADLKLNNLPKNLSKGLWEDFINRFNNGVTIFHYHSDTTNKWNLAQTYENWEVSLL